MGDVIYLFRGDRMPQSIQIPATLGRCDACHRGVHQLSATAATYVFALATRSITRDRAPHVCVRGLWRHDDERSPVGRRRALPPR